MEYSIASYSFHRLLANGQQDMFKYITDCKALGCAVLDPWNGHLAPLTEEDKVLKEKHSLAKGFSEAGLDYVQCVKTAADAAGLPFGCLAVDGAHIYEETPEQRAVNRASASRWLDVAKRLGAAQIRIDSGGTPELPDEQLQIIIAGYKDFLIEAQAEGIEVIMENHWGASRVAENIPRMLDAVDGLGLLFDSNNFAGDQESAWRLCAPYARSVHIKTFEFADDGSDPTVDIPLCIQILVDAGYKDIWGIESVPRDGDEIGAVKKTIALLQRSLGKASS